MVQTVRLCDNAAAGKQQVMPTIAHADQAFVKQYLASISGEYCLLDKSLTRVVTVCLYVEPLNAGPLSLRGLETLAVESWTLESRIHK